MVVLQQGEAALARIAQATQPNGTPQLGEVHPVRRPLLSANQNDTPAALSPLSTPEPEGGARCVSSARRDLYGGRLATAVPTVTIIPHAPPASRLPERAASPSRREVSPAALTLHKVSTVLRLVMKRGAVDPQNLAPLM